MKDIQKKYFKMYVRFIKDNIVNDKKHKKKYSYYKDIIEEQYYKLSNGEEILPHCYNIGGLRYDKYVEYIFEEFYKDINKALKERLLFIDDSFHLKGVSFNAPKEYFYDAVKTCRLTYFLEKFDIILENLFHTTYEDTSFDLLYAYFFDED